LARFVAPVRSATLNRITSRILNLDLRRVVNVNQQFSTIAARRMATC
jgi:hypothetical protein